MALDKLTVNVKYSQLSARNVSAIMRGYHKSGQCKSGMEGTPVAICSIYPPERASEGFKVPLEPWMLEIFAAFDVQYMHGMQEGISHDTSKWK